nr:PAS domain S-box protein [uncultured Methanoregula sp.]
MKLQEKTSLILIVLLMIILTLIIVFVSGVSLSSYSALEHRYVLQDVDEAVSRLEGEYSSLSAISTDWGQWDDTYAFVNGNKPDYASGNLVPGIYNNLRLNLIVITNRRGEVVYAGAYDLRNHTMTAMPAAFGQNLGKDSPLLNMTQPQETTSGLLVLDGRPMIIASCPILHSDLSGTPQGVVIMGRYLDNSAAVLPGKPALQTLRFIAVNDPENSPDRLVSLKNAAGRSTGITETPDNNQIAGYALIRDIYSQDALVLEITEPREIYNQGVSSTTQYILIVLAAGLLLGVTALLTLDRLVLSRLTSLGTQVQEIGRQTVPTGRLRIEGSDEISELSQEINRMLETVEKTHDGLMQSEARFREMAELLPQSIFEMDADGRLRYVNRAGFDIFGMNERMIAEGVNVRNFVIPEDIGRVNRGMEIVMKGKKSSGEIYHLIRKDGTIMSAVVFTAPIYRNGTFQGFRGSVNDITDRVNLEEALIESQEYLQTLLWSVKAGIIVIDAETHRIVDANPAALEMIGATKDQLINKICHDVICPAEEGRCPITDLSQTVDNSERELVRTDGRTISVIKYVVPVLLQGRPCLLETFIDNTARKKIERDLRESTELITGILQASPAGVFRLDARGNFTFVNDMFTRITGMSGDQIRGRYWLEILHPNDQKEHLAAVADAIRRRSLVSAESRFVHASGTVSWLLGQAVPLIDPDGNLTGWVGSINDISERKKMEEALRQSRERLSSILRASPVGVFETTETGTLLYVNERWEEMAGMTFETMRTRQPGEIHNPLDRTRISKEMWKKFQARLQPRAETRFMRPDGSVIWIYGQSVPVYAPDGKIRGYVGTITDISDRKRIEDAIHLANKKLNLMNDITRHDILNTITGIFGLIDMAVASGNREQLAQLLSQIKDEGRLIQRQITFTRDYQGVGVNAPVWQNVRDVAGRATASIGTAGISIVIELENTEIFADPLLEKVFYNLADNAIRYGGSLTTIRFYYQISDSGLALICEDDGTGIPKAEKEHIFERGVGKNTGMGLFLTREILRITGISIRETGIFGKGARFEMLIPSGMWRFAKEPGQGND